MALPDLTDTYINDNYTGLLHTSATPVDSATMVPLYDGVGNALPIKVSNEKVSISNITYPLTSASVPVGYLFKNSSNEIAITNTIPPEYIQSTTQAGTYSNILSIALNDQGQVTAINTNPVVTSIEESIFTVTSTTYMDVPVITTAEIVPELVSNYFIDGVEYFIYYNKTDDISFYNLPETTKTILAFVKPISSVTSNPRAPYALISGRPDMTYDKYFPVISQSILGEFIGVQFITRVQMVGTTATFNMLDMAGYLDDVGVVNTGPKPNYTVQLTLLGYQE